MASILTEPNGQRGSDADPELSFLLDQNKAQLEVKQSRWVWAIAMISTVVLASSLVALGATRVTKTSLPLPQFHPAGTLVGLSQDDEVAEIMERARLADQAERYDDVVESMKLLVEKSQVDLTDEQRNLLSTAYEKVVGAQRSAWRIVSSIGDEEDAIAKQHREDIEKELNTKCNEVLALIDDRLLPAVSDSEVPVPDLAAKVFYETMKGDFLRYEAEVATGAERDALAEKSEKAYFDGTQSAQDLPATHPIRLRLALNYSVFLHDIKEDKAEACEVAKKAFDEAIAEVDSLPEDSYKHSTLIMQLLRDNFVLWTSVNE